MNPRIENVAIDSITVGTRLRKDYGDIQGLAESITDNGLLHPLVIDQDNVLICGGRRLQALRQLGFEEVPVRRWQVIDARHRKAIELAENVNRKDLTEAEKSRDVVKAAELAREVDQSSRSESDQQDRKPQHREKPGSDRRVSELTGIPKTTIKDAEKHVAAVDAYPFLEEKGWKQYHAMEAAEALDKLPEEERPEFVALIDQPGIPPRDAIRTLQNVTTKPEPERKRIIALAHSEDDRDRSLALTEAAAMPAMPDPRLEDCRQIRVAAKRAIASYPNDPEIPAFQQIVELANQVADAIRGRRKDAHAQTAAD